MGVSFDSFNIVGSLVSDSLSNKAVQDTENKTQVAADSNSSDESGSTGKTGLIVGIAVVIVILVVLAVVVFKKRKQ